MTWHGESGGLAGDVTLPDKDFGLERKERVQDLSFYPRQFLDKHGRLQHLLGIPGHRGDLLHPLRPSLPLSLVSPKPVGSSSLFLSTQSLVLYSIMQWLESCLQSKRCCPTCKQPAPPKKLYRIFLDFEAIQIAALSEDSSKGKSTSNNDWKDAEKQDTHKIMSLLIECKVLISQFSQHDFYSFPQAF